MFKVVDSNAGPTIAHLRPADGATCVEPDTSDSRSRLDRVVTTWLENNESLGWGPVDGRTEYRIGKVTKAPTLNRDETVVSGAGLHVFNERDDAVNWMEQADI